MEPMVKFQEPGAGGFGVLVVLAFLWEGVVVTIFWMVCGWRAHERIAVSNPPVDVHFADVCGDGVPQFG